MKKNLISVLILALMVVNIVLTSIMMFSVMGTAKKTGKLVTDIATVLSLELTPKVEEEEPAEISMADTAVFDIPDNTIILKREDDGKEHYCITSVSIMMNTKHEDYATYSESMSSKVSVIKSIVSEVFGSRTIDEAREETEEMKAEILVRLQEAFGSTFIYKVAFSDTLYQ
ncbi:MAG: flagellar basal body-associated FliL family protein [Lachnospiraceae bacterium]|nr:flagellar basal body-associated FliL family protein [Lachnospiraceae bacterium]